MIRVLIRSFIGVVIVVAVLIGIAIYFLYTESGTRLLWQSVQILAGGSGELGTPRGRMSGPLVIDNVSIISETAQIDVKQVSIDWDFTQLLMGKLLVHKLEFDGIHYFKSSTTSDSPNLQTQLEKLRLPFELDVRTLKIQSLDLFLEPDALPIRIDYADFEFKLTRDQFDLKQIEVTGPIFQITGDSELSLSQSYVTTGAISWRLKPKVLTAIHGDIQLSGQLNQLNIGLTIEAPYNTEARIKVDDLLTQPQYVFDVDADDVLLSSINEKWPAIGLSIKTQGKQVGFENPIMLHGTIDASNIAQFGAVAAVVDAHIQRGAIVLTDLSLSSPDHTVQAKATGRINIDNNTPTLNIQSDWRNLQWPLNGVPLLGSPRSKLIIQGPIQTPSFALEGDIDGLIQSSIQAQAKIDMTTPQSDVDLKAHLDDLRWPTNRESIVDNATADVHITGNLPNLTNEIIVNLGQSPSSPVLNIKGDADFSDPKAPQMAFDGGWNQLQWPLDAVEPIVRSTQGKVKFSGTPREFTLGFESDIGNDGHIAGQIDHVMQSTDINAEWNDLAWKRSRQSIHSKHGTLHISGNIDDYRLALEADTAVGDKLGELSSTGQGNLNSLSLDQINLDILNGSITGGGSVVWKPWLSTELHLMAQGLNPGVWWQNWNGGLNGELMGSASMKEGQLEISNFGFNADGVLREYPLKIDADGSWQTGKTEISNMKIQSAESIVQMRGKIDDNMDLQWQIVSDDLQTLYPHLNGSVMGSGSLTGSINQPKLNATLSAQDLRYQNYLLSKLNVDTFVDTSNERVSKISANAVSGRVGGVDIESASLNVDGTTTQHRIVAGALTSLGSVDIDIGGQLNNTKGHWLFDIADMDFETKQFGTWRLVNTTRGQIDRQQVSLSPTCLSDGTAKACLQGMRSGQELSGSFNLEELSLETLSALLPSHLGLNGTITGNGHIEQRESAELRGELRLQTSAGQILLMQKDGDDQSSDSQLTFGAGSADIEMQDNELRMEITLPIQEGDMVKGYARVAAGSEPWLQRPIDAEVTTEVKDVAFIGELIPQVERFGGQLQGTMRIDGILQEPRYDGQISWSKGRVELPGPGVILGDIDARLSGNPFAGMNVTARGQSDGGVVKVDGNVDFSKGALALDMEIQGDRVQVSNTPQAKVYVSPDLHVGVERNRLRVEGTVNVPRAQITLREIPKTAIKSSSDQVIVNETTTAQTPTKRSIIARVRTVLGDDVNFNGFGLSGRLGGEVVSIEKPGEVTIAEGEINILDGRYEAYGQNLTIQTGRLLFSGAEITNPALDLRATRQPTEDVIVGVTARGTLQQPEFSLYSEPSMTERNQLSYLLLGRPADTASSSEKSALGQAALALGLKRAGGITDRISDQIGLDQLGVEAQPGSTSEQAAFVIGKYLTPKLYVSYGIGLFEPINTLRLRYSINRNWKLETESSGRASGGDIIYSIEGGR